MISLLLRFTVKSCEKRYHIIILIPWVSWCQVLNYLSIIAKKSHGRIRYWWIGLSGSRYRFVIELQKSKKSCPVTKENLQMVIKITLKETMPSKYADQADTKLQVFYWFGWWSNNRPISIIESNQHGLWTHYKFTTTKANTMMNLTYWCNQSHDMNVSLPSGAIN